MIAKPTKPEFAAEPAFKWNLPRACLSVLTSPVDAFGAVPREMSCDWAESTASRPF